MYKPLVEFPLLCGGEKEDVYKVLTITDTPLYLKVGITKSWHLVFPCFSKTCYFVACGYDFRSIW